MIPMWPLDLHRFLIAQHGWNWPNRTSECCDIFSWCQIRSNDPLYVIFARIFLINMSQGIFSSSSSSASLIWVIFRSSLDIVGSPSSQKNVFDPLDQSLRITLNTTMDPTELQQLQKLLLQGTKRKIFLSRWRHQQKLLLKKKPIQNKSFAGCDSLGWQLSCSILFRAQQLPAATRWRR